MHTSPVYTFRPALETDARAIADMRTAANENLTQRLGNGPWNRKVHVASIRERIREADLDNLKRSTIFLLCDGPVAVGSVIVSTYPPGFWKQMYWSDGRAKALGVFNLIVHPDWQRKGLGRTIMCEVERLASGYGIQYVRLDAYAFNPLSTGFYRAIGYDERATINLRGCNLVLFEKRIHDQ